LADLVAEIQESDIQGDYEATMQNEDEEECEDGSIPSAFRGRIPDSDDESDESDDDESDDDQDDDDIAYDDNDAFMRELREKLSFDPDALEGDSLNSMKLSMQFGSSGPTNNILGSRRMYVPTAEKEE
jgi:hypothetical protein